MQIQFNVIFFLICSVIIFGVVLLYDSLSPVEYHVILNNSSLSLFDVVKGGEDHVPNQSQDDIHNSLLDNLRLQKKGGVCIMCVNIACCFSLVSHRLSSSKRGSM